MEKVFFFCCAWQIYDPRGGHRIVIIQLSYIIMMEILMIHIKQLGRSWRHKLTEIVIKVVLSQ